MHTTRQEPLTKVVTGWDIISAVLSLVAEQLLDALVATGTESDSAGVFLAR